MFQFLNLLLFSILPSPIAAFFIIIGAIFLVFSIIHILGSLIYIVKMMFGLE